MTIGHSKGGREILGIQMVWYCCRIIMLQRLIKSDVTKGHSIGVHSRTAVNADIFGASINYSNSTFSEKRGRLFDITVHHRLG